MKIIVAGGGKVGSTIVKQLSLEGHDITLIDIDTDQMEKLMEQYDIIGIHGNAASMDALYAADIEHCELLIAVTDRDEVNLLACMTAHAVNKQLHTIARIRRPEYLEQSYQMREQFGLNHILNPEQAAAKEIERLLQFPGFQKIETFAHGNFSIAGLKVKADSPLKGVALNKLNQVVKTPVLLCAVQRGDECIIPRGQFVIEENDTVYFTAAQATLSRLMVQLGYVTKKVKSALITGGSRISYYLAKELARNDIQTTIIEQNKSRCEVLAELLPKTTIVHGDASAQSVLEEEGIEHFDAFVTMTGMDELNIVMSLYASERNVPIIVTKLSHAENNKILDKMSIGSVISPKDLISASIIHYVRGMHNTVGSAITIHQIADGRGEAIEFNVTEDTKYIGRELKDLPIKQDVLIAGIVRNWNTSLPTGNSKYQRGDQVIVVTNGGEPILRLNDIFEE